MNEVINFNYEGNEIPFKISENGEVFMNATVMVKMYSEKRVNNFLRKKETLEYINAMHRNRSLAPINASTESPLIEMVRKREKDSGTWFHEDLALFFAQYLSSDFHIWCNQRIKEIMNRGFTALTPDPEGRDVIDRWAGFESRKQRSVYQMLITSYLLIWKDSTFQSKQKMGLLITNVIGPLRKVRQSDT